MESAELLKREYERVKCAADAHTNLNIFSAIAALLEGRPIYGASADRTADKIIKLCKAEQQRQIKVFDKASGRDAWIAAQGER